MVETLDLNRLNHRSCFCGGFCIEEYYLPNLFFLLERDASRFTFRTSFRAGGAGIRRTKLPLRGHDRQSRPGPAEGARKHEVRRQAPRAPRAIRHGAARAYCTAAYDENRKTDYHVRVALPSLVARTPLRYSRTAQRTAPKDWHCTPRAADTNRQACACGGAENAVRLGTASPLFWPSAGWMGVEARFPRRRRRWKSAASTVAKLFLERMASAVPLVEWNSSARPHVAATYATEPMRRAWGEVVAREPQARALRPARSPGAVPARRPAMSTEFRHGAFRERSPIRRPLLQIGCKIPRLLKRSSYCKPNWILMR